MIASLVLMGVHWARMSGLGMRPVNIDRHAARPFEFQLDINTANWVEWAQLEGIGDQLARRIVEDREKNGPFPSVEDLNRVPGIGPKTLEKLRPWIRHAPKSDASYQAMSHIAADVAKTIADPVPLHLRNAPTRAMKEWGYGQGYQHAHLSESSITGMECLPESLRGRQYYHPTQRGVEKRIGERMEEIRKLRAELEEG